MTLRRTLITALLGGCLVPFAPMALAGSAVQTPALVADGGDARIDKVERLARIDVASGYGVLRADGLGSVGLFLDSKSCGTIDRIFTLKASGASGALVAVDGPVEVWYWRFGLAAYFPLSDRLFVFTLAGHSSETEIASVATAFGAATVTRFDGGATLQARSGSLGLLRDVMGSGRHGLDDTDPLNQETGGGGGTGGCSTDCTIGCNDGSTCECHAGGSNCCSCSCSAGAQCTQK